MQQVFKRLLRLAPAGEIFSKAVKAIAGQIPDLCATPPETGIADVDRCSLVQTSVPGCNQTGVSLADQCLRAKIAN
jgi:hypothetical protein